MFWPVEDYPRDLLELEARFSTEAACREYLAQLRWPGGFFCPRCGGRKAWPVRGVLLECSACGAQTSVTAGTIFQDTRTPLPVWFRAMWWVTTQKNGASAMGLQRVLGLKSYETAWTWLHKLRRAMVRPGRDLLSGRIEVDEGYIGGEEEGLPGRLNLEKTLVVVAAQEDGKAIGRIRMRQIPNASAECLMPFVRDAVVPGSTVHTDGWLGYLPLKSNGFQHQITYLKGNKKTDQGAVSHKHLDYYLDEFTFRFNRRRSNNRGKLFYRLSQQAVAVDPVPLDQILHPDARKQKPSYRLAKSSKAIVDLRCKYAFRQSSVRPRMRLAICASETMKVISSHLRNLLTFGRKKVPPRSAVRTGNDELASK